MKTRQAVLAEPGRFEFREVDLVPGPGQVLVKVAACGLCNWELTHWRGITGTCPQTLGHEWTGIVAETGEGVSKLKVGDPVAVQPSLGLAGFADYALNTEDTTFRLDESVDVKYAIAEPVKCVTTVLQAAAPVVGDYGAVVGCGPMGLWSIMGLKIGNLGALIAIDMSEERLELARNYGATHTVNIAKEDAVARIQEITDGHLCDFVIEGSGAPGVLENCFKYIRFHRGRICLMSSAAPSKLDMTEAVERGCIINVTHPQFSHDQADDLRRAIMLINNGTYQIKDFITHEFALEDIQQAFEFYSQKPQGYMKGIVCPNKAMVQMDKCPLEQEEQR